MDFVQWGKIPRFNKPWEITEKIDGTNGIIFWTSRFDGKFDDTTRLAEVDDLYLYAGSRNRWLSPEVDNYGFAKWAKDNAESLRFLGEGRHFGEWFGSGIQRRYGLAEKQFALFDTSKAALLDWSGLPKSVTVIPVLMHAANGVELSDTVRGCMEDLRLCGSAAVPGFMRPEGVVVRHTVSGSRFKVLLEGDDTPKGMGDNGDA